MIQDVQFEKYSTSMSFKTHPAPKYYTAVYDIVREEYTTLRQKCFPPSRQLQDSRYKVIYQESALADIIVASAVCCCITLHCVATKDVLLPGPQLSH